MQIIDFHSHVLPGIDDGSKNLETSLEMLRKSKESGVDIMVATPHFYADCDRVESFLEKRSGAFDVVSGYLSFDTPKLLLGAEVAFFDGIGKAEKINELTIKGTDILLLEMPFKAWDENEISQVKYLISKRKLNIIIAHLERYMKIPGNASGISSLLDLPVTVQINAGSLIDKKGRSHLIRMFKQGKAHLLGSDCHGINHRPPNLMEGRGILEKKAGSECLDRIDETGSSLLGLL